jgi:hypothetical protein
MTTTTIDGDDQHTKTQTKIQELRLLSASEDTNQAIVTKNKYDFSSESFPDPFPCHSEEWGRIFLVQLPNYITVEHGRLVKHEVIESLKELFTGVGVPGRVFEEHVKQESHFRFVNESMSKVTLPSRRQPRRYFGLPYFEQHTLQRNLDLEIFLDRDTKKVELTCASTGKQIQYFEFEKDKTKGPLLTLPRKMTFWASSHSNGGWDGTLISS